MGKGGIEVIRRINDLLTHYELTYGYTSLFNGRYLQERSIKKED